jgi:predicted alpha-1,2-mannosidase
MTAFRIARSLLATALFCGTTLSAQTPPGDDPVAAVDPFIGTSGEGHTFPGAVAPFGMVQLSPDTHVGAARQTYNWAAGYRHEDPTILGFSHTHFSGAGHSDLGDFLVSPVSGDTVPLEAGTPEKPGYRSRKADEIASPGYYAVTLTDPGVRAEMTAGTRIGVHRYTFPSGRAAHLVVDLRSIIYDYPGKILWSSVRIRSDGTITGSREVRGWATPRRIFFAMRFSAPLAGHRFVSTEENILYKGFKGPGRGPETLDSLSGRALVAQLDFGALAKPLEVKVALSGVDEDGAIANLASEPGDFDMIRSKTRAAWAEALGAVTVTAPAPMRRNIYTALYHSLMAPSVWSDADGRFRGPDDQVHGGDRTTRYSTFSLWDTFRAEHPLLTLIQSDRRNADFVNSLIDSQATSPFGILPVWQFGGKETWTMIGYHAVPVIADACLKGIKGIDCAAALKAMVASADYAPYGGLGDYMKLGYVPIDREPEAASKTVEYAYDDWTIARLARQLGDSATAPRFEKRAQNWRNSFDTKTGFLRARKADGTFRTPFDPTAINYGSDYTEGNAWQYSWFMPHDQGGLIRLLGGDAKTVAKLDAMFDYDNSKLDYSHAEDIAGLIGQYIHGNEPSHHVAYLYSYAGQPWRTQERLKQIVDSQYKPTPDGLAGNDDLGQMSAWLVFTALGFYPVAPGSNQYVIGRPFVERADMTLPNGQHFTIVAEGLSDGNPYIGRVTLNGKPLDRSYITDAEIRAGGELRFTMQAKPNRTWATGAKARPYSTTGYGR